MNFAEVRQKYPQYSDLSDEELAVGLHKKFYADLPFDEFAQKVGYSKSMSLGDKWSTFIKSAPGSASNLMQGFVDMAVGGPNGRSLANVPANLGRAAQLPIGLWNKVMPEGLNIPGQGEAEQLVDNYGQHLKKTYAADKIISAPEKTIQTTERSFINDPFGVGTELVGLAAGGRGLYRGAKTGVASAATKIAEGAPEAVTNKVGSWAETLYGKAISPPTRKSLSLSKVEEGLRTGLDKRFIPTRRNLKNLKKDIWKLNDSQTNWFKGGVESPVLIPVDDVVSALSDLRTEFAHDAKAMGQINRVSNILLKPTREFGKRLVNQDGKVFIPSDVAHDLKRSLYKELGSRPYGVVDTLPVETLAKRRLASSLLSHVAEKHPKLAELTSAESKLIGLQEIAEPRIRRELNNQWWSLGTKAAMVAGKAAMGKVGVALGTGVGYLNRTPSVQARIAIQMDRLAKAGVRADRAAVERILASEGGVSIYSAEEFRKKLAAEEAEPGRAAAEQNTWKAKKIEDERVRAEADASSKAKNEAELAQLAREREAAMGEPTVERNRAAAEQAAWKAEKKASDTRAAEISKKSDAEVLSMKEQREAFDAETFTQTVEGIPEGRTIVLEGITEKGKKFSYRENARAAYTESATAIKSLADSIDVFVEEGDKSIIRVMSRNNVPPAVRATVVRRLRAYLKEGLSNDDAAIAAISDTVAEFEKTRKAVLTQTGIPDTTKPIPPRNSVTTRYP